MPFSDYNSELHFLLKKSLKVLLSKIKHPFPFSIDFETKKIRSHCCIANKINRKYQLVAKRSSGLHTMDRLVY